jgi:serine/threonine protein kinase
VPIETPQALDSQGKAVQALPGRVQFRLRGHQRLTVTIAAEDWTQARLPRHGSYRLVPDNLAIQLLDLAQGYPLACVLVLGSLVGGLRWRHKLTIEQRRNQELESRQKPGDDPLLGTTVGGYRLLERLGQGGMATVYRARAGTHEVALKLLVGDRADPDKAARFRRECRLAAQLKHPTLVRVIESGEQENLLYLVMELVEGEPLRLRPSGLDWEQIWPWYRQLLVGLNYAHGVGVVHRDLKPENILVRPDGGLKVVDFGLARTQDTPAITETGKALGTPSYLAPEQLTGAGDLVEPRTDQYALGVILFQALTGSPPFRGLDASDVAAQHLSKAPPRVRDLRPDISVELDTVVTTWVRCCSFWTRSRSRLRSFG